LGNEFNDYKDPKEYVLTIDNAEAKISDEQNSIKKLIGKIYSLFRAEYIKAHPQSPKGMPIDSTQIHCGISTNHINIFPDLAPNQTLPIVPNSYTDNASSNTSV
jgi:hypothetical protein